MPLDMDFNGSVESGDHPAEAKWSNQGTGENANNSNSNDQGNSRDTIKLCNKKYLDMSNNVNIKINNYKTTKQRHLSSNSLGENCDAQELPLIG